MNFVVSVALARLLNPEDFGLIAMTMIFIIIAQVFVDGGFSDALIQRKRNHPVHYSSVFYFNILIAFFLFGISIALSEPLARFYGHESLALLIKYASSLFVINSLSSVHNARLREKLNYKLLAVAEMSSSLSGGAVGVYLAFNGFGVWSLVAQYIFRSLFYNIIVWFFSDWRPGFSFSFKALKQLWIFSIWTLYVRLLDRIFAQIDFLFIGKLFPVLTLGFYQRAKSFNTLSIQLSSGVIMDVLFPVLSSLKSDRAKFDKSVMEILHILSLTIFAFLGVFYVISEDLVLLVFGDKWLPSVPYLKLLILSSFGKPYISLFSNVLRGLGEAKVYFRMDIFHKILYLLNGFNAVFFGIEAFLLGLILVEAVTLIFVSYIGSLFISFRLIDIVRPMLIQSLICVSSVFLADYVFGSTNLSEITGLFFIPAFVIASYFVISLVLKTDSCITTIRRLNPIYLRFLRER